MVSSGSRNSVWPGRTRAVNHAGQLAALPRNHRHHKTLVADRDVLFLQNAFVAIGAQKTFERFLNAFLLLLDVAAQAMQMRARAVEHGSVALDLAFDFFQKRAKVSDALRPPGQQREPFTRRIQKRSGIGGAIEKPDQIEDFARLQRRAFDVQLLDEDGDVGKSVEIDPNRRALPRRLRSGSRAQIANRFARFGESGSTASRSAEGTTFASSAAPSGPPM